MWLISYLLIGVAVGVAATIAVTQHFAQEFENSHTISVEPIDFVVAGFIGVLATVAWPIVVPSLGFALIAKKYYEMS